MTSCHSPVIHHLLPQESVRKVLRDGKELSGKQMEPQIGLEVNLFIETEVLLCPNQYRVVEIKMKRDCTPLQDIN